MGLARAIFINRIIYFERATAVAAAKPYHRIYFSSISSIKSGSITHLKLYTNNGKKILICTLTCTEMERRAKLVVTVAIVKRLFSFSQKQSEERRRFTINDEIEGRKKSKRKYSLQITKRKPSKNRTHHRY